MLSLIWLKITGEAMNIHMSQSLQLKQTLKLNQVMIQRFNILQKSSQEFESMMVDEAKKNPFIQYRRTGFSDSMGSVEAEVSPIDFATYDESLLSILTNQLDHQFLNERDNEIVLALIDACDQKGFISNYKAIRSEIMAQHTVSESDVFRCLKTLQSFEPEGVGARSLNECLWIQIDNYDLEDTNDVTNLKALVKHHLEDISNKNYDLILTKMNLSQSELDNYMDFISHLNPNPGSKYSQGQNHLIQPSLRVDVNDGVITLVNLEEERLAVSLNDEMIEKLKGDPSKEVETQLYQAKIWIDHFNKRQQLLKFCGEYLIQKQRLYFLEGDKFILPCLQKDMAKELNVSESTISRLVRTKYIQTSHGIILIQTLCQRNIYGKTKQQVKSLVFYYCERYPNLSDQKLSELLKGIGLPIARRTVTKYRHEAKLASSYTRSPNQ